MIKHGAAIKDRLSALTPDQRALLAVRLKEGKRDGEVTGHSSIPKESPRRVDVDAEGREWAIYPASHGQQWIWFLHQYQPDSPAYNSPTAFQIRGRLDVKILEAAFQRLVERHDVLRTTFAMEDSELVQRVASSSTFRLEQESFAELPAGDRRKAARQDLEKSACLPFSLAAAPAFRVRLISIEPDEHILLVVLHHIISDGWSCSNLFHEISAIYPALLKGSAVDLPQLSVQYADYSAWQRRRLRSDAFEEAEGYWKRKLADVPERVDLPSDQTRAIEDSSDGATSSLQIDADLVTALKARAQKSEATLFMMLLAAFKLLLHRYTGQTDVLVGVPMTNRQSSDVEGLIGLFIETLVMRTDFSSNPTFEEFLGRVKHTALDAYEHQDMPFDMLISLLQIRHEPNRQPLFQTMFAFQDFPETVLSLPDLEITRDPIRTNAAKLDLILEVRPVAGGLKAILEFNSKLFSADFALRLLNHWRTLLQNIVSNPTRRLSEISMLSEAEKNQVLEWNKTERDYPKDQCLHELFEEQARQTPEAVAAVFENRQLTYRELNSRGNQLAQHLRKLGVGPDTLVGICAGRSLEMVIGLVGVLKAGGAYVPLDPEYPKDRMAFMVEDAAVSVLLTQATLAETLPASAAQLIRLDMDWPAIAKESEANLERVASGENLAYMIYTSGSTGRPKGAMNTHQGIVNRLLWMQDAYQLSPADRVLQKTPFSFDVSVWEFFWPLLTGATLVFARPGGHRDGAYLAQLIEREKITTLHFVPSMLQVFLEQKELSASCASLKRVICSGEALTTELQGQFFSALEAELHNLYGPTEAAVDVTYWACQRDSSLKIVPIGKPIANIQTYILDAQLQPVPVGVAGELHLGGIGLARGYHNRPELTAEKFIRNPFSKDPKSRLYKTGDLTRYLPDGNIEYMGRLDHQVKIRGFRIEMGEIEEALNQHPGVQTSLVMAREDTPGDKRLVAYLTKRDGGFDSAQLREHLSSRLPEYMVPAAFVALDSMPLTPNGKVDRKSLPRPDFEASLDQDKFVAPRTPMEISLAEIWCEILNLKQVGIRDSFFELGGNSIMAVRLINEIKKRFHLDLRIPVFFRSPTIEKLATVVVQEKHEKPESRLEQKKSSSSRLITFQANGKRAPIFFLHGDWTGGGLYCGRLSQQLGDDQPFYAIPPYRSGRQRTLTMEEMVAYHLAVLQERAPHGPYILGGYCIGATIAMEIARQLIEQGEEVQQLILLDPASHHNVSLYRLLWFMVDKVGDLLKSDLLNKILFFNHYAISPLHWFSLPIRDKISALERRMGLTSPDNADASAPGPNAGEDHRELLKNLDYAVYSLSACLYALKPFSFPATVYFPEDSTSRRIKRVTNKYPTFTVDMVPGNHQTCISKHAEDLAVKMKQALGNIH